MSNVESEEGRPEQAPEGEPAHDPMDESPTPHFPESANRPSWAPRHYGDEGYPDPYAQGINGEWLNP